MRLIIVLSVFLLSMSAWAGTFRDDFEDGDWKDYNFSADMRVVKVDPGH